SRSDFTFDKEKNEYRCPNGKALRTTGRVHDGRTILYRASERACGHAPLKSTCCPNVPERKVPRDVHEEARDHARALMGTPEFEKSRNERKRVEMRLAHLKTHHRFERMRLRGLTGARDEFHLVATVQNLKTLANHSWCSPANQPAPCGARGAGTALSRSPRAFAVRLKAARSYASSSDRMRRTATVNKLPSGASPLPSPTLSTASVTS